MIFQHHRFQIWGQHQHPFSHTASDIFYANEALPGSVTGIESTLDYLVAVLYPKSQPAVADVASLPLVGNNLNDMRVVQDDGDGKAASYRWEQREGDVAPQWYKIYDVDWGTDSILQAWELKTQDIYVVQRGYDDRDETGAVVTGILAGQSVYGGASANTNLTLFANSGDGVGADTGYVQFGDQVRPIADSTYSLGTTSERWLSVWSDQTVAGTLTIASGSITDTSGAISFGNENLTTGGSMQIGSMTILGGSINDTSGSISFDNENLSTTGTLSAGVTSVTQLNVDNNLRLDGNVISTQVVDENVVITPNGTGILDVTSNARVQGVFDVGDWGSESAGIDFNGTTYQGFLNTHHIAGGKNTDFVLHTHATTRPVSILAARSRGNSSAHVDVQLSDELFKIESLGWAGTNYKSFGNIGFEVDSAGTVSNTSAPGLFRIQVTPTGSITPTDRLTIDNAGEGVFTGNFAVSSTLKTDSIDDNGGGFVVYSAPIYPDALYDLGTTANPWSSLYIANHVGDGSGTNIGISVLLGLRNATGTADGQSLFWNNTSSTWEVSTPDAEIDHTTIANITTGDAGHTQFVMLAGRVGGQTIQGGTGASENLTLESTSNATKGFVLFSDSICPSSDASYSGGWTGTNVGDPTLRVNNVYSAGEFIGFRPENVGSLPGAATANKGRIVYLTTDDTLYVDTGLSYVPIGSGSGSGVFNYVLNPGAESNATSDVTVTGSWTVARGTTEATYSDTYFDITGTTASGDTVDWALDTLNQKHDQQVMTFKVNAQLTLGSGTGQPYKIGVYNSTDATYVSGTEFILSDGADPALETTFTLDRTKTYVVRLESITATGAADDDIYVDDVTITPYTSASGTSISPIANTIEKQSVGTVGAVNNAQGPLVDGTDITYASSAYYQLSGGVTNTASSGGDLTNVGSVEFNRKGLFGRENISYFNGANHLESSNAFFTLNNDFSFGAWIYIPSSESDGTNNYIISKHNFEDTQSGVALRINSSGLLNVFACQDGAAVTAASVSIDASQFLDKKNHFCVVWNDTSNTLSLFINGKLIGEDSGTITSVFASTAKLRLGAVGSTGGTTGSYIKCEIEEFFFTKTVLSESTINGIYSRRFKGDQIRAGHILTADSFELSDLTNKIAFYSLEADKNDGSVNAKNLTLGAGSEVYTGIGLHGDGAFVADGTARLELNDSLFDINTATDFIMFGAWINPTKEAAASSIAISFGDTSGTDLLYVNYRPDGLIRFQTSGGTPDFLDAVNAYTPGKWAHVVVKLNAGVLYAYVNGISVGSITLSFTGTYTDARFVIGTDPAGTNGFTGYIREAFWSLQDLTDAEIKKLMASKITLPNSVPTNRQIWTGTHYADDGFGLVSELEVNDHILDRTETAVYLDLIDAGDGDMVELVQQDGSTAGDVVPVKNWSRIYTTDPDLTTNPVATNLAEVPTGIVLQKYDNTAGAWKPINPQGYLQVADDAAKTLSGDISALLPSPTEPVKIVLTAVSTGAAISAASATSEGLVNTGAQTFAGDKTFSGNTTLSGTLDVVGNVGLTGILDQNNTFSLAQHKRMLINQGGVTDSYEYTISVDSNNTPSTVKELDLQVAQGTGNNFTYIEIEMYFAGTNGQGKGMFHTYITGNTFGAVTLADSWSANSFDASDYGSIAWVNTGTDTNKLQWTTGSSSGRAYALFKMRIVRRASSIITVL